MSAYEKTKTIPNAKHIGIVFPFAARLQNCEIKSNRAGLGCANPNKVPEDTNSFLADDAKLALSKFWPRNEQTKTYMCGTRRILLLLLKRWHFGEGGFFALLRRIRKRKKIASCALGCQHEY